MYLLLVTCFYNLTSVLFEKNIALRSHVPQNMANYPVN